MAQVLIDFPKPIVAALKKPAQGLGAKLVSLCDLVCDEVRININAVVSIKTILYVQHMLWLNCIFLSSQLIIIPNHTPKPNENKFKPRLKYYWTTIHIFQDKTKVVYNIISYVAFLWQGCSKRWYTLWSRRSVTIQGIKIILWASRELAVYVQWESTEFAQLHLITDGLFAKN